MTGANSYFQWTRDSALVFKALLNQYLAGNASLETFLRDYAAESDRLQHTPNPSGGYASGGLGEPKFHDDGRAFTCVTPLHCRDRCPPGRAAGGRLTTDGVAGGQGKLGPPADGRARHPRHGAGQVRQLAAGRRRSGPPGLRDEHALQCPLSGDHRRQERPRLCGQQLAGTQL